MFSVSLLVLAAIFSLSSYFSNKLELQTRLEIAATNAVHKIDFDSFYLTGNIEDLSFDESAVVANIMNEFSKSRKYRQVEVVKAKFEGLQFWIEVSMPWVSPLGGFEVMPKFISAKMHLSLDSNRHLQ